MKTLILNGSPRKNGDTVSLINTITQKLNGEYRIVNAYYDNISPCVDCRYCWKHSDCSIKDEMLEIYAYIEECDNIIIASPIYFSELTGKLLDISSRLQKYFCAKQFRKENLITKSKKGAIILVGGGNGSGDKAYSTACTILHLMNCHNIYEPIISHNTDSCPAIEDKTAVENINKLLSFLNNRR